MEITDTLNTPTAIGTTTDTVENPDGILGKDDFLQLLLIELQYQDPTDPMDSDKILTQTAELASLEAADNTNKALEDLSATLTQTSSLSAISAIGKMGSLGTQSIFLPEDGDTTFELYFPQEATAGTVEIKDINGNSVRTFDFESLPSGINAFNWDGTDDSGNRLPSGSYSIEANYTTPTGESEWTTFGIYPIESVRFEGSDAYLKMGSQYYPLDYVVEIYEG